MTQNGKTYNILTASLFRKMVSAAERILGQHAKYINALNVFPVPDGDTGSNMMMTVKSGNSYVQKNKSNSIGDLTQSFAEGLLMGARGNSGVISSQIFRGFANATKNKKTLTATEFSQALLNGSKLAYKAVMKPTEGTILTVIREASEATRQSTTASDVIFSATKSAERALQKTPDLLPVLKKAGVVDSGGQGLVLILKAWNNVLHGIHTTSKKLTPEEMNEVIRVNHHKGAQNLLNPDDIKYTYCTQMTVRFGKGRECDKHFDYQPFYDYLAQLGNSLLVANDNHVVKVHVHTETPWKVLKFGQHYGDLTKVKVDNMHYQQEQMIAKNKKLAKKQADNIYNVKQLKKIKTAVVPVSVGKGIHKLFKSEGAFCQVSGGQTMNPTTADILKAINKCGKRSVLILPNNGNVLMASQAAAQNAKQHVLVLPNKTVQSGLSTMINYTPTASVEDNYSAMKDGLQDVKSAAITLASRDDNSHDISVHKNDYIGITGKKILYDEPSSYNSLSNILVHTIDKLFSDMDEVVTLYYGAPLKLSSHVKITSRGLKQQIQIATKRLKEKHSDIEIEIHNGGQPIYPILIQIE